MTDIQALRHDLPGGDARSANASPESFDNARDAHTSPSAHTHTHTHTCFVVAVDRA